MDLFKLTKKRYLPKHWSLKITAENSADTDLFNIWMSGMFHDFCLLLLLLLAASKSEAECSQQILMDANLSVEAAMITLDVISLYVNTFKVSCFNYITEYGRIWSNVVAVPL